MDDWTWLPFWVGLAAGVVVGAIGMFAWIVVFDTEDGWEGDQ